METLMLCVMITPEASGRLSAGIWVQSWWLRTRCTSSAGTSA